MTVARRTPEQLVVWRLMELMDRRSSWHRGLWQVGTVATLEEVLEYAEGAAEGSTTTQGLEYVCLRAGVRLAADQGLSPELLKLTLPLVAAGSHKKDGLLNPRHADELRDLIRRARGTYLGRWADAVDASGVSMDAVEEVSRAVAAHLLDEGFSADHLHGWLRAALSGEAPALAALIAKAASMCAEPTKTYDAVVPFEKLPQEVVRIAQDRFLDRPSLLKYCQDEGFPEPKLRGPGALRFRVIARDPQGAVEAVADTVRRLTSRVAVGLSNSPVETTGTVLVLPGKRQWRDLTSWRRELMVPSLVRRSLLLPESNEPSALDDAFELLAAVETSTSWASVAASWAAIEGLLARPGESGVSAADALASIVACSFPRAELTSLMETVSQTDGELGEQVRLANTQAERIGIVLDALNGGKLSETDKPLEQAAIVRMELMVADPQAVLSRVHCYFSDAFRRLYNQRNLVMHRGSSASKLMPATLRTVPPLVAAGIDRLVNAEVNSPRVAPLELATRATGSLSLAGADDLASLLD